MTRRTIAVTGSASGIGGAVRSRLLDDGHLVVGVDVRDADVVADLATAEGCRSAVAAVTRSTGGRLEGVVTCAGLGPHVRPSGPIVRVNYFGALRVLDGLLPALERGTDPAAVAISSNSAGIIPPDEALLAALGADDERLAVELADAAEGAVVYGTSKLAVARAVRRRASAWGGAGVRLNAVAPGPVETPLLAASRADPVLGPLVDALPVPFERPATPDEIAGLVCFLLAPASGVMHGSVVFADGGTDALVRPDAV